MIRNPKTCPSTRLFVNLSVQPWPSDCPSICPSSRLQNHRLSASAKAQWKRRHEDLRPCSLTRLIFHFLISSFLFDFLLHSFFIAPKSALKLPLLYFPSIGDFTSCWITDEAIHFVGHAALSDSLIHSDQSKRVFRVFESFWKLMRVFESFWEFKSFWFSESIHYFNESYRFPFTLKVKIIYSNGCPQKKTCWGPLKTYPGPYHLAFFFPIASSFLYIGIFFGGVVKFWLFLYATDRNFATNLYLAMLVGFDKI